MVMKVNSEKNHLLLRTETVLAVNTNEVVAFNSKIEKLHSVTIDYQLHFVEHFSRICVKPSQKIRTIVRISSFMN